MIKRLFEEHKLVRRVGYFGVVGAILWATYQVFHDVTAVSDAAAKAYIALTGLLAVAHGFYSHGRGKEGR